MDISTLLNYGRIVTDDAVNQEIAMDVQVGIIQQKRSMYYDRSYGCAISENSPAGLGFIVNTRHSVATFIAERNLTTGDGTGATVDRRAITSQNLIQLLQDRIGNTQISVMVIPMRQQLETMRLNVPIGGV